LARVVITVRLRAMSVSMLLARLLLLLLFVGGWWWCPTFASVVMRLLLGPTLMMVGLDLCWCNHD
jgi:hypothetical protein